MNKMLMYVITIVMIIAIGSFCLVFCQSEDGENVNFLKEYGWETEAVRYEKVDLTIPETFDNVYNNYNELQKNAGLDLSEYKGKKAVRYTYIVKNFPYETDETVYANILCVDGKQVAGDIMTASIDGFMVSLAYLENGL